MNISWSFTVQFCIRLAFVFAVVVGARCLVEVLIRKINQHYDTAAERRLLRRSAEQAEKERQQ